MSVTMKRKIVKYMRLTSDYHNYLSIENLTMMQSIGSHCAHELIIIQCNYDNTILIIIHYCGQVSQANYSLDFSCV